ncbi:MAG: hypothetical protein Kow00102_18100 [Spirochaetota bacterium]
MKVYDIDSGSKELIIHTKNWAPGIYYYSLRINGRFVEHNKMIIGK